MSQENTRIYSIIHIISETLVAIGFLIGVIPFAFWATMYWVIPLVVVNVIISIVARDKTLPYTLSNLVLSVVSIIPIIGSVTALAGVVMSVLSVVECASILNPNLNNPVTTSTTSTPELNKESIIATDVEIVPTKTIPDKKKTTKTTKPAATVSKNSAKTASSSENKKKTKPETKSLSEKKSTKSTSKIQPPKSKSTKPSNT